MLSQSFPRFEVSSNSNKSETTEHDNLYPDQCLRLNPRSCGPGVKRLYQKELTSKLFGLSFPGLVALSLSLLEIMGAATDQTGKQRKKGSLFFLYVLLLGHWQLKEEVSSLQFSLYTLEKCNHRATLKPWLYEKKNRKKELLFSVINWHDQDLQKIQSGMFCTKYFGWSRQLMICGLTYFAAKKLSINGAYKCFAK